MRLEKFEDLIVWQKGRVLVTSIYRLTRLSPFSKDSSLTRQIQRSSLSIMSNIAEGFARRGDGEWSFFLNVALGSSAETKSHLYVALDLGYVGEEDMRRLHELLDEISRMLNSLRKNSEKRRASK